MMMKVIMIGVVLVQVEAEGVAQVVAEGVA